MIKNIKYPLKLNIKSRKHLLYRLNINEILLNEYLEHRDSIITTFIQEKIKRNSTKIKKRKLSTVPHKFKIIHRNINQLLHQSSTLLPCVIGGVKNKTMKDFIEIHLGCEGYLSCDLKDFFPSISSGRIIKLFRDSGCSPEISGILTDLTTYNGELPQGFSTSTMLANIIAHPLDKDLLVNCNNNSLKYARWIDDIVISGRIKDVNDISPVVNQIIAKHHFNLNSAKTKFSPRRLNKETLGLKFQKNKPHIPDNYIEQLESDLQLLMKGEYTILFEMYPGQILCNIDIQNSVIGKIDYIKKYNPTDASKLKKYLLRINWEALKLYTQLIK